MSMRSGQPGISAKEYSKLNIPIPSLDEQSAIVRIIKSCDVEIDHFRNIQERLKLQKKGLMQKLLSGQLRTNTKNIT